MNSETCGQNQLFKSNSAKIIQGYEKIFFVDLFYADTGEPFDLTGATEIKVALPTLVGQTQVVETLSAPGNVTVIGAAGAGKIRVKVPQADSVKLQPNPYPPQLQDLQVSVTIGGVATGFILSNVLDIDLPSFGVI